MINEINELVSDGKQKIANDTHRRQVRWRILEWDKYGKKISEGYYKNTKKWTVFWR